MNDIILLHNNSPSSWTGIYSLTKALEADLKEDSPVEKIFQKNMNSLRTLDEEMMQLVRNKQSSSCFPQFYSINPPLIGFGSISNENNKDVIQLKNRCKDIQRLAVQVVLHYSCSEKEKEWMSSLQKTSFLAEQYLMRCFLPPQAFNHPTRRIVLIFAGCAFLGLGTALAIMVSEHKTVLILTSLVYGIVSLSFFVYFLQQTCSKSLQSYFIERINLTSPRYAELKAALDLPV